MVDSDHKFVTATLRWKDVYFRYSKKTSNSQTLKVNTYVLVIDKDKRKEYNEALIETLKERHHKNSHDKASAAQAIGEFTDGMASEKKPT